MGSGNLILKLITLHFPLWKQLVLGSYPSGLFIRTEGKTDTSWGSLTNDLEDTLEALLLNP